MNKRIIMAFYLVFIALAGVFAQEDSVDITILSFTNELERPIEYFEDRNPGINVHFIIHPMDSYDSFLQTFSSGEKPMPDIIVIETAWYKKTLQQYNFSPLDSLFTSEELSGLYPYIVDFGRDADGQLYGLPWQAYPGVVFYRRSLARKYLGTDDPRRVQKHFFSWEAFLETARVVDEESRGQASLFCGVDDLERMILANRTRPWVVNNTLVIDPYLVELMDIIKELDDDNLHAEIDQWSPAWFDGMMDQTNIFSYFLPPWGLQYVLKPNAPDSSGDWGACSGPVDWFWGGSYLTIPEEAEHKEEAALFIRMMVLNDQFKEWWCFKTGEFSSQREANVTGMTSIPEYYLNGQSAFPVYQSVSEGINGNLFTEYDTEIDRLFMQYLELYISDQMTKREALEGLQMEVKALYPELIVQ